MERSLTSGSRQLRRPAHVAPMLAVRANPEECQDGHHYEYAYDGVRAVAHLDAAGTRLESRRYRDITGRYPEVMDLNLTVDGEVILDGELVVMDGGRPAPDRLQRRRQERGLNGQMTDARRRDPITFVIYDLLWHHGRPLWDLPYERRRATLETLALDHPCTQVVDPLDDFNRAATRARARGFQGLVAKRLGSPYRIGQRSSDWRTVGFIRREEFVVGGYIPGQGQRAGSVGALLVGRFPTPSDERLRYAGSVGTGFTESDLDRLGRMVHRLEKDDPSFRDEVPREDVRFCEPELVIRVQYREETDAGLLRYPVFKGVLDDVAPSQVCD